MSDKDNQECTQDEFEILTTASSISQKSNDQLYQEMKEARDKLDAELKTCSQEINFRLDGTDSRLSSQENYAMALTKISCLDAKLASPKINFCLDGCDSRVKAIDTVNQEQQNKDWFDDPYEGTNIGTKHLINIYKPMCPSIKSSFGNTHMEAIQKLVIAVKAEDSEIKDDPGLSIILGEIYKNNDIDIDKAMNDAMSQAKSGVLKKKSDERSEEIIAKRHNQQNGLSLDKLCGMLSLDQLCGMMAQEKKSTLFSDQDEPFAALRVTKSFQPMCHHTNSTDLCETVIADRSTTTPSQPKCSNEATLGTRETPNLFSEQNDHHEYIKILDDEMKSFFNKNDDTKSSSNSSQKKDFSTDYIKKADKFHETFNTHVNFPDRSDPHLQKDMTNENDENIMQNSTDKLQHSVDIIQEELEKQKNSIIQHQVDVMQRQINAMQRELNRIQREAEKEQCPTFLMSSHFPTMPSMKLNRRTGIRKLRRSLNPDMFSETASYQKPSLSEPSFEPYSATTNYCKYIPGKDREYSQGYHEACGYPIE